MFAKNPHIGQSPNVGILCFALLRQIAAIKGNQHFAHLIFDSVCVCNFRASSFEMWNFAEAFSSSFIHCPDIAFSCPALMYS